MTSCCLAFGRGLMTAGFILTWSQSFVPVLLLDFQQQRWCLATRTLHSVRACPAKTHSHQRCKPPTWSAKLVPPWDSWPESRQISNLSCGAHLRPASQPFATDPPCKQEDFISGANIIEHL